MTALALHGRDDSWLCVSAQVDEPEQIQDTAGVENVYDNASHQAEQLNVSNSIQNAKSDRVKSLNKISYLREEDNVAAWQDNKKCGYEGEMNVRGLHFVATLRHKVSKDSKF